MTSSSPSSSSSAILNTLNNISTSSKNPTTPKRRLLRKALAREGVEQSETMNSLDDLEARVIEINKNTDQRLIIVSHDKTLLCLRRNLTKLGKSEWVAPLSTVTTILVALITSDFKSALWLGPSEWKAMFVISGFLTTGWLAFTVRRTINTKSVHEVVHDIASQLGGHMSLPEA